MKNSELRLSRVSAEIRPFRVMEILEKARALEAHGRDIIHLEIGEPDFPTPPRLLESASSQLRASALGYTPSAGLPALREKIAEHYQIRHGLSIDPRRVFLTPGASGALSLVLALLVDPGDEFLLADPGYPCYPNFLALAGGRARRIPVLDSPFGNLSSELIRSFWSGASRGVIVASPSNPTGNILEAGALRALVAAVESRGGVVVSDEIYQGLEYRGRAVSALAFSDNAFVINSFSKYFGMTGWRLGWAVVPEPAVIAAERLVQNLFISAPTLSQRIALRAFDPENLAELERRRRCFDERRGQLLEGLERLSMTPLGQPDGAFYVYADVSRHGFDSRVLADRLLDRAGVAVTPGFDFGLAAPEHYLRFSYTVEVGRIQEACDRMANALGSAGSGG